jgi:molybdopterin/thiamine biosynthesis adenylyltransferase
MADQGPALDAEQLDRYSRHVVMDDVGPTGQAALLDAAVLVVGAGGLGSPAIQYLAAAGVGRLGVVDDDAVELSNLQRQVLHGDDDVGRPKVESARDAVAALNPDVTVEAHETRLAPGNAADLVSGYDFVLDATDNFRARYLVNDACTLAGVPFAHGAVYRFEGQVTTFHGGTPCYRCLFPEAPEPGTVPNCATAGVLGVVPAVVGSLQATEAVKHVLGAGESLAGRLLVYDALSPGFDSVTVRADPNCPVCGEEPRIEAVADAEYGERCAL